MPPDAKTSGAVIVCERTGRIASLVRSKFPPGVPLVETRTAEQCQQLLADLPASFLIVEATGLNLDRCLRLLKRVADEFAEARSIVVADRQLAAIEAVLREAGAVHIAFGLREMQPIIRLALRHAQCFQQPTTLAEEIWGRLPWPAN
jgi:hypothetical protein